MFPSITITFALQKPRATDAKSELCHFLSSWREQLFGLASGGGGARLNQLSDNGGGGGDEFAREPGSSLAAPLRRRRTSNPKHGN